MSEEITICLEYVDGVNASYHCQAFELDGPWLRLFDVWEDDVEEKDFAVHNEIIIPASAGLQRFFVIR